MDVPLLKPLFSQDPGIAAIFASLESSPDPVFVTDRHNRIVFWNDSARAFLGWDGEDVMGRLCSELLKGCDEYGNRYCSEECPIVRIARRNDVVQAFPLRFVAKDQRTTGATIAILQLRPSDGGILLLHILRPAGSEQRESVAQIAPAPRPQVVAARESADARARKLTSREVEVLGMLAAGRSTPEIAERLHISPATTRDHIQHILEKLEVHSKAEAVAFAFQKNLI